MADNSFFGGGQPDPNAGASGSFTSPQVDPNAMAALQQLIQSSQQQQNTPAMSLPNGSVGNVQGQQLPPQAQESAAKALKQYYDAHAQQVLAHPDGVAALSAVANQGNEQNPSTSNPQQNSNPNGNYQPQDILSKLLAPLGITQSPKNQELLASAQATRQQVGSGQPSQIQLPSAQASQVRAQAEMQNLQNSGNEPIQPKEYMSAYAGMYQKALDSYGKVSDSTKDIASTAQELFSKTSDATRNAFQKTVGLPSKESAATFQSAIAAQKAALDATADFHSFLFKNNPSQVMNKISQKVSGDAGGGLKVGDKFNGETVTNVRRIK